MTVASRQHPVALQGGKEWVGVEVCLSKDAATTNVVVEKYEIVIAKNDYVPLLAFISAQEAEQPSKVSWLRMWLRPEKRKGAAYVH
ncbi:Hvp 53 VSH-1 major tail protein [Anopheles sinensis]|uniref:Hvp 53 VSH-1 major tail protein n=1 Tax=Anopheles sinensis TaxID=74873 RepID=A0A084VS09_ANOSI|nr:Hvp 53 VSH-1 major tail protein [Anopheles sinensis]